MTMDDDTNPIIHTCIGHEGVERHFLEAVASGRMHHAWLMTGPKGIGKATLAFQFAAHLLSNAGEQAGPSLFGENDAPAKRLHIDENHPAVRQMLAGSHPDFRVVTRAKNPKTGQIKNDISVDEIRALGGFLNATAAMGGWRVVIIDAADDMNRNAANALLKMLEEPPNKCVFLVISHSPGKLLPTIRSRCLHLRLKPISVQQVADIISARLDGLSEEEVRELAALSLGSPGVALELAEGGGAEIYALIYKTLSNLPAIDMTQVFELAQVVSLGKKQNAFQTFIMIFKRALEDIVHWASGSVDEAPDWALALPTGLWLQFYDEANDLMSRGESLNLEPRHVVINLFGTLQRHVSLYKT